MLQNGLPKEAEKLEKIIEEFGLEADVRSVNPVNSKNYENKISNEKKGDFYLANLTYGGRNHKVYISPNGHSFKEYKKMTKKLLKHLDKLMD